MKKRLFAILVLASLVLMLAIPAFASGTEGYIIDECDTISAERLAELNEKAAGIVNGTGINVVFVITDKSGEGGILGYIEDLYSERFGGTAGIIVGHDTNLGKWAAERFGEAAELLTESDEDALFDAYNEELTYGEGVEAYLNAAAERITAAHAATMPEDNLTEAPISQPTSVNGVHVVDMADLLSDDEEAQLRSKLEEISNRQNADVVFVTVNSTGNKSAMDFADDFFDYNGYRTDGILMLVSMQNRDWWVSTAGRGITAVTEDALDRYEEESVFYMKYEDYATACSKFADLSDEFLTLEAQGTPYQKPEEKSSSGLATAGVVSAGVGLATGAIGTGSMKSKLKSVHRKRSATEYMKRDSLNIVDASEIYLYSNVTRTYIERDRDSHSGGGGVHVSSSGTTHGGGGGHF